MKKILISTILLFLSIQISFAWACWGKVYYIYENQQGKIFYIWQYSFENIFWDFPIFATQNLTEKGTHLSIWHCVYEWFENLEEWTFFDYSFLDKLLILWNIGIVLSSLIVWISYFRNKKENKK